MENLKIEYMKIKDLKPYKKNTRKHQKKDVDNIARSIEKYGMNDPIGIWGDNIIVEGHGRMLACKQIGMDTVPVVRLDHLTDEQRREYAIAHNATAELSEWDLDILPDELADLDLGDFDFDFVIEDVEEAAETNTELGTSERELEPYKYIHYLVTIETNEYDRYVEIIKTIEEMGATVRMTRNDT